jgi:lipopolysaccharide export system protein LptC
MPPVSPDRPSTLPGRRDGARVAVVERAAMPPPSRERRAPSTGELARRRFAVRWAKRLLPVVALGLLGLIAFWPEIEGGTDSRVSFRRTVQPRPEALRVVNPRYQGIDELGRPYTITARTAQQQGAADILDLDEPRGDILMTDGAWVFVESNTARYDKPASHLDLKGDVRVYHDDGLALFTEQAAVQIDTGVITGTRPVAVQGSFGTLTAEDGFRVTEKGAVVNFLGRSHAVLEGDDR